MSAGNVFDLSVFADHEAQVYSHQWTGSLIVSRLVAGTPSDPKVIRGWIETTTGKDNADLVRKRVADTILELEISRDEAIEKVADDTKLNMFKRDEHGLFIEGRQLKACIKEAANICWSKRRWGPSAKGTRSFFAEHVFVQEVRLHLGVQEPTEVQTRFVHTWRGSGIQCEQVVDDAKFSFTVVSDFDFEEADWRTLWLTAQRQGIGAVRSQSFGTFAVTSWARADS